MDRPADIRLGLVAAAFAVAFAGAADVYVSKTGSAAGPYGSAATGLRSIQAAVNYSSPADVIRVTAGTYAETVSIDKSLSLVGEGVASTIVDGGAAGSCVSVSAGAAVTLSDLQLRNGLAEFGGGVYATEANLTLTRLLVTQCTAGRGGGIYAKSMDVALSDSVVSYCTASTEHGTNGGKGGGLYLLYTPATSRSAISGTAFFGNRAVYGGAIRFWQARAQVERCQFFHNRAEQAVLDLTELSDVNLVDVLLHHNQSLYSSALEQTDDSAAVFCYLTVSDNESSLGAAVLFSDVYSDLSIWNSAFQGNSPDGLEVSPATAVAGSVFSTPPEGIDGLTPQSGAFASGDDGNYYLAAAPASPTVFIGAGSADCPYAVDDAARKCCVSGPAAGSPPNAGYGYPLAGEGKLDVTRLGGFALRARGAPYLSYGLEWADDAGFTTNPGAASIGSLVPSFGRVSVDAPTGDLRFYRMKGAAPSGYGATITVRDTSAAPVAGVNVDLLASPSLTWAGFGVTQADGTCRLTNLAAGSFTVLAGRGGNEYVPAYLGDTTEANSATVFSLSSGAPEYAGTVTLRRSARLQGRATCGGRPLADATVTVYDTSQTVVNSVVTDASGDYTVGGLDAGSYKVSAAKTPEYRETFWQNAETFAAGTAVTVADEETKTVDLALNKNGKASGVVTVPEGGAVFEIVLVLYRSSDYEEVDYTFADENGAYELYGPAETYVVSAGEGSEYVVQYSNDTQLAPGSPVSNVNFSLQYGGTISGSVTDAQGAGVPGLYVDFYIKDDNDDMVWVNSAVTDASSDYQSPYLAPNTYYVQVYGNTSYTSPWYLDASLEDDATGIPVAAHDELTGIDFRVSAAR